MDEIMWMVDGYEAVSAADEYWFGFVLRGLLFLVQGMTFEELKSFFRKSVSSGQGGKQIRLRATEKKLAPLLSRAILLGSEDLLVIPGIKNKGEAFEKVVYEKYTGKKWVKDSTPFWVAGDMRLDGKEIQIKFNEASLVNEQVFRNHFPELLPA